MWGSADRDFTQTIGFSIYGLTMFAALTHKLSIAMKTGLRYCHWKSSKRKPKSWQRSKIQPWSVKAEKLSTFEAYPPNHCVTSSWWYLGMLICCRVLPSEIKAQSSPFRIGVLLFARESSVLCSGSCRIACHQQQPYFWTRVAILLVPFQGHSLVYWHWLLVDNKKFMQVDDNSGSESSFLESLLHKVILQCNLLLFLLFWYLIGKA